MTGVPCAVVALLELRAWRRRKRREARASHWPPAESRWTESLGMGAGRAFTFDAALSEADAEWHPPTQSGG